MLASVSRDYLRTMRVPVLRGRALEATDFSGGQPVALVSEDAARQLWPRGNAIGSRATLTLAGEPDRTVLIVGVVANLRSADVFRRSMAQVYVPWTLRPDRAMAVTIRTEAADPVSLAPAVRAAAAALEPNEPIFAVSSMEQVIFNDMASQHILTGLHHRRRVPRAVSRRRRHLRRGVVRRRSAHARDRRAHGARRATVSGAPHDRHAGCLAGHRQAGCSVCRWRCPSPSRWLAPSRSSRRRTRSTTSRSLVRRLRCVAARVVLSRRRVRRQSCLTRSSLFDAE